MHEAQISLIGFVATQPKKGFTKSGLPSFSMRVGWTPRTMNRDTGEWADRPTSFATVQCYRKTAEHAGVCLRRGDPVVVRGALHVREYTDQAGQRRVAVEIIADSIGHDMSRGISNYSRPPARTALTADEYEKVQAAAAARDPLPGDVGRAESDGGQDAAFADDVDDGDSDLADEFEPESDDVTESELAAGEEFDESAARDVLAGTDAALEPASALT